MIKLKSRIGALALLAIASVAVAQSPGSVESELGYAQEYMDKGNWGAAKRNFEHILRMDPDNAQALAGLAKAKALYEAQEDKKEAQARGLSTQRPDQTGLEKRPAPGPVVRKTGPQSKKAMCDDQYGTCHAIYKSVATCAPRRAMCYTQNGVN